MTFFGRLFLAVAALSTLVVAQSDDDYSHLLECLTQGSDSSSNCSKIKDCVWCPSVSESCCSKEGICVSSAASTSFSGDSHYQCSASSDDDVAPHSDDDYFPPDDDATFDDDKAVDDDAATTDDDAAATDDDANNDDIDTDDYNPYDDDQATTDDDANTDDDNTDEYIRKLLECLAIGNSTGCARNTPTECVWCTTSFGEGLCVSDEAGKDIDGYFYTCQWNATMTIEGLFDHDGEDLTKEKEKSIVDSSVYDHYCWNAHDQEACEDEVDGRDLPCVWCPALVGGEDVGMCLSMAQTDLVEQCQVEKQE